MTDNFLVPDFAFGDGKGFRISASNVADRHSHYSCRMGLALTARQKVGRLQPNDQQRWRSTFDKASTLNFAIRDFTFELARGADIQAAIDANKELTHAQRRFIRHALNQLGDLLPSASEDAGSELHLADELTSDTHIEGIGGEVTVFGRHLVSQDGAVHEVVRMRLKQLRPARDEDADWTAVAALTLAFAAGVPPTARIRVSEFSLANGDYRVVFDGGRADAARLYEQQGKPLRDALHAGPYSPGQPCVSCAFLNVCPAVPQRRGVLGIPGRAVATRYLTSADLAAYDRCPTAFLAQRRDHLPDGYLDDADKADALVARERGIAVHKWLSWAHSRIPPRGCAEADLPAPDDPAAQAAGGEAALDLDSYRIAYPYLVQHLRHCPCGLDGLGGWAPEARTVVFDPDADVVVITTPDLRCTVAGSDEAIWRETKTAGSIPAEIEEALWRYPGYALNIALLAADATGTGTVAHAELEVLTPTDSALFYVATSDGELVVLAQKIVAGISRKYASDLAFERRPGSGCATCSANRWCNPPLTPADAAAEARSGVDDDEFADMKEPF